MHKRSREEWKGSKAHKWLMNQFDTHDPIATSTEIIDILKSEQAAIGLFKAIAGLSKIAEGNGDKAGMNACCDCLTVLANAHAHIGCISEDWQEELNKPGSSFA